MSELIARSVLRRGAPDVVCAAAALTAAAAHVPVTGPHLVEAPYVGLMFIALEVLLAVLVPALLVDGRNRYRVALVVVGGAAIVAYVLTRSIAFPLIGDDVGNWLEPLGVVSITTEAVTVAAALTGLVRMSAQGSAVTRPGDAVETRG